MFDITIVTQSFLYRPRAVRGRRESRTIVEEEEGLLNAGTTGAEDATTPSRRRLPAAADEVE
jgi:solute carrier family 66 (lysosomal lysine-arginine transporter), member 1